MYIAQLYMHSLSSVKIAYHGDDGGDEYHCAHVVMFNLFEYVLYCFKCDSVDDDDKMVIWCTIAQIWCTIAPGFMGDGSKPPPESALGPKLLHSLNLDCTNHDCTKPLCTNREANHSRDKYTSTCNKPDTLFQLAWLL